MLHGIDTINWSELTHAYGSATDIPALLRASLSENPDHREFAFELLHSDICHQGTIYQATSQAVSFLVRMLSYDQTPDPVEVIILLWSISRAYPQIILYQQKSGIDISEVISEKYFVFAREAHAVARRGLGLYMSLISHSLPMIRECVIRLLCSFPEDSSEVLPILYEHIRNEVNDEVQGDTINSDIVDYLLQISDSWEEKARFADLFEEIVHRESESIMARFPASCAVAKLAPQTISDRAIDTLVYTIAHPEGVDPYSRFIPPDPEFLPPDMHKKVCEDLAADHAIEAMSLLDISKSLPTLLRGLRVAIRPEHAHEIATKLLCLLFLGKSYEISPAIFDIPEFKNNTIYYSRSRKNEAVDGMERRTYPILVTKLPTENQNPFQVEIIEEIRTSAKIRGIKSNLLEAFKIRNEE